MIMSKEQVLINNCYNYLPEIMNFTQQDLAEVVKLKYYNNTGTVNGIIKITGNLDIAVGDFSTTIINNDDLIFMNDLQTFIIENRETILKHLQERRACQSKKQN